MALMGAFMSESLQSGLALSQVDEKICLEGFFYFSSFPCGRMVR
jgi:hypothetical protein